MVDDRRRDAPDEPTTGQRVRREVADFAADSTISVPGATPDLIAQGLAQIAARPEARAVTIDAERAAESNRRAEGFDPLGATLDHSAGLAGGTLDLPVGDQVASAGALDPGQVIGHFVIRSRLGEGGMGMVLAGYDADLGRPVAIKVVKDTSDHPAYRARLLREAQVMARLEHPNVVRVYEVGSDRGRLFVAMELVDGVTLTTWLEVQRRTWRETLAMFQQVGAGLATVHRAGLVHRDFKPDNVLVDRDGRARVADFGLARLDPERTNGSSPALAASLTRTGMLVGTPAYMAPEQHFGGDVDARADQYSYCVSLREALIGSRPAKIEDAHWKDVPRSLRIVIDRGASVDVNERFASMDDLLDALARGASRRALYVAAAAAVVVLVGGGIGAAAVIGASNDDVAPAVAKPVAVVAVDAAAPTPIVIPTPSPADERVAVVDPPAPPAKSPAPPTKSPAPVRAEQSPAPKPPAPKPPVVAKAGTTTIGDTSITPMTPVKETDAAKKHNQEPADTKHEMIAGHRNAVRDALRDFGFLGLTITGDDREADLRELEGKLAASTDDLQRGQLIYAMGMAERARDNCIAAIKHWREAKALVLGTTKGPLDATSEQRRGLAFLFYGRMVVAEAYCDLANGRALGINDRIQNGLTSMWHAKDPERAEVWLAMGIALYETGEEERGKELLLLAGRNGGSDKLRAAITAYANAVGLKL